MKNKVKKEVTAEDQKIIEEALRRYKYCKEQRAENDELALDDVDFRNGDQWHDKDREVRIAESRPCLTINKLEQRVDQVTGDQRMNRMGAIIRPLDSAMSHGSFKLAEIYSGIIKNIESVSNAKSAYDNAFDCSVGHGFGFWRIRTDYEGASFDQEIKICRIANSFSVDLDPDAEEVTKMDAKYGFVTSLVDKEEYPDSNWEYGKGEEYELWKDEEKVRIAEYFRLVDEDQVIWLVDGKVLKVKDDSMDVREALTEEGVVPEKERTIKGHKCEWFKLCATEIYSREVFPSQYIPIIGCYGKVLNVRGRDIYRGVIRHAKDPQRVYNYTRSASIEQVALAPKAPIIMEEEQMGDHKNMWETSNTKNYPVLPYKHKAGVPPPQRQAAPQPSAGWISEASIADQDIDAASGMYKASLGAPSNERSGKAINARKVEGDVGTYHFHDNRAMSLEHTYKILVDMIPRVYDTQRVIRIKKFDDKEEMVEINKTITNEAGEVVKVYDLNQGKYDVAVDVGASYTTQRQMASESMMELIQYAPQIAEKVMPVIAKNLDWPGADEIVDLLTKPQGVPEEQVKQMIDQAVQQAQQQTEKQVTESMDTENKSKEIMIKKMEAVTKRMKVMNDTIHDEETLQVEVLKILQDNMVTSDEITRYAMELASQISEPNTGAQQINAELMQQQQMQRQMEQAMQQQPVQQGAPPQGMTQQ